MEDGTEEGTEDSLGSAAGGGRVLLVDDEPDVRELLHEALEEAGHQVVAVGAAAEALEALGAPGARFAAIVTDYAMPRMTGGELVREARRLRPGLPALVTTGYAEAAQLGEVPPGVEVLRKPFRMDQLAARVTELVGAAEPVAAPAAWNKG